MQMSIEEYRQVEESVDGAVVRYWTLRYDLPWAEAVELEAVYSRVTDRWVIRDADTDDIVAAENGWVGLVPDLSTAYQTKDDALEALKKSMFDELRRMRKVKGEIQSRLRNEFGYNN